MLDMEGIKKKCNRALQAKDGDCAISLQDLHSVHECLAEAYTLGVADIAEVINGYIEGMKASLEAFQQ